MDNFDQTTNICRICLMVNNEEIQCVFDTINSAGEPVQFSEILMAFAEVTIISGDELPDQICSTCAQNTIKLYLFKIKCEESDKTLRNRLKEDSFMVFDKIEKDEERIMDNLKFEIKKEASEDVLEDSSDGLCAQQIETHHLPEKIFLLENFDAGTSPECNESLIPFNNKTSPDSTLAIKEEPFECDTSEENELLHYNNKAAELPYKIKITKQKHAKSSSLTKYKLIDSEKSLYECEKCKLKFFSQSSDLLARHKCTRRHLAKPDTSTGKKLHECDVCDKKFSKSYTLICHKRTHTGEKPYECDICETKFNHFVTLKLHKRTHTGEKPYQCDDCDQKFSTLSGLKVHKRRHTGERPYKCDVCEKSFSILSTLTSHKLIHTDEKPYECDECEKKFRTSRLLQSHKRTHTGEKPYECDVCEKKFSGRSAFAIHKRTHTGEKPLKCNVCEKEFAQYASFIHHKRTHTGEKPYRCGVCEKSFSQLSGFNYHKRTHTGEKPYKCDDCKKTFAQLSALTAHKRTHTGEKCDV